MTTPLGKISLSQPIADLLNQAIMSDGQIVIIQLDGNSISNTPPAVLIAAIGPMAERMCKMLNEQGIKDKPTLTVRPQ